MGASLLLASVLVLAIACRREQEPPPLGMYFERAQVVRVIDGDTIEIASGEHVRYLAIDTPQTVHPEKPVQCYGKEASDRNKELVEGRKVKLLREGEDKDKFGRLLRYVFADGILVNAELVWEGYAYAKSYDIEPSLYQVMVQLERSAREAKRGLWAACEKLG